MLSSLFTETLSAAKGRSPHRRRQNRTSESSEHALGSWVWLSDCTPKCNCYVYLRKTFCLPSKPKGASISVAACSKYKLYVNGKYISQGPARAPQGFYYYDTHDITQALTNDENVVALLVHYFGVDTYAGPAGKPGLNCRIDIELEDERLCIRTDETWLARPAEEWTGHGGRI
ncbi:MAG: alpha-L-rhamnosidase N-terminal domain-containing protein, partial [Armatimonadota bacterium]|nr:alpha-L-rhamnosidase N-terminal domain-containing protein [Armatimonadota bacterium]